MLIYERAWTKGFVFLDQKVIQDKKTFGLGAGKVYHNVTRDQYRIIVYRTDNYEDWCINCKPVHETYYRLRTGDIAKAHIALGVVANPNYLVATKDLLEFAPMVQHYKTVEGRLGPMWRVNALWEDVVWGSEYTTVFDD